MKRQTCTVPVYLKIAICKLDDSSFMMLDESWITLCDINSNIRRIFICNDSEIARTIENSLRLAMEFKGPC